MSLVYLHYCLTFISNQDNNENDDDNNKNHNNSYIPIFQLF